MVRRLTLLLKLRPFKMKTKLSGYAMLVLLPVFLFCLVYKYEAEHILEEKAGHLMKETLGLSTLWLDEVLSGAVRISAAAGSDSVLNQFILNQQASLSSSDDVIAIREARHRMNQILNTEERVTSIWIYFPLKKQVLSSQYGSYNVDDNSPREWLEKTLFQDKYQGWVYPDESTKEAKALLDLTGMNGDPKNVSFIRILPGLGTDENPVIMGTTYHTFTIDNLLAEVSAKARSSILLLNQKNQIVNSIGKDVGLKVREVIQHNDRTYTIQAGQLVTHSTSELTGWKIVASAPLVSFMGELPLLNGLLLLFFFVVLTLSIFVARSLTKGIHQPLTLLLNSIKNFENGNLSERMHYYKRDEFGAVAEGFNQMAAAQENLIRSVYEERIAKQQAELNFLSSQINPHFLYNTLGALYSMAKKVDSTLAKAIISMSRLFRLSLTDGKEKVTIAESIEHINHFVYLLNIRNPNKYILINHISPEAERCMIPSLIIQPIVENAVKHGIETRGGIRGVITISASIEEKYLILSISDNGIGMDEQTLHTIKEKLHNPSMEWSIHSQEFSKNEGGTGYALLNICKRLQLYYGDEFKFTIDSEYEKGTTVTYRLKKEV
jgi:two-component system, sensor histidine kinase YesM